MPRPSAEAELEPIELSNVVWDGEAARASRPEPAVPAAESAAASPPEPEPTPEPARPFARLADSVPEPAEDEDLRITANEAIGPRRVKAEAEGRGGRPPAPR